MLPLSTKQRHQHFFQKLRQFILKIRTDPKTRKIFYFLLLNLSFTVVEALYGFWTNSLGLASDAVHMLFDSTAIIFSLIASVVAKWPGNDTFTFGYSRVETLTGFLNGAALLFAGCSIIWESFERMFEPPEIIKDRLLTVAILGFLVNLVGIFAFDHGLMHGGHTCDHDHSDDGHNPLMQGMFLHVLADTLGSVGVITSSVLIEMYGWTWADPLCSLFIAIMIVLSVWPLLKNSAMILLERVPYSMEQKIPEALRAILALPRVINYHSVHFWEISSNNFAGNIAVQISADGDDQLTRISVSDILSRVLQCRHISVQVEKEGAAMGIQNKSFAASHDHFGHNLDHSRHSGHSHDHDHSGNGFGHSRHSLYSSGLDHSRHGGHSHDHSGHSHDHGHHNHDNAGHTHDLPEYGRLDQPGFYDEPTHGSKSSSSYSMGLAASLPDISSKKRND